MKPRDGNYFIHVVYWWDNMFSSIIFFLENFHDILLKFKALKLIVGS
jgi:hypothetical protein